jgi:5'-nucleotidase/UDP-sugar diphosphatase
MVKSRILGLAFMAAAYISNAEARLIQILHTNDTHSFLDGATHTSKVGGTARLKSLVDYYKGEGQKSGMKSLVLDGGDFLEGNIYYMADQGMKSFEAHNNVGYNMVALGNHDYMMGAAEMDKMLGKLNLNFSFLAANVHVGPQFPNLRDKLQPYKEITIDGIKIAVLGLTTADFLYSWRMEDSKITDPFKAAEDYEEILKKRNNDFIIALTHIGVKKDQKLAKKTSYIDLIVGGHSHTALYKELYETNKKNIPVPIVQAGKHTEYLGRLVVDLVKGQPLKVISYELVPVTIDKEDTQVKNIIEDANINLADTYGEDWLKEKIGYSDLKPKDPSGSRKWAYYIADALREKAGTDMAIHAPPMNGENYPVGEITRRTILNSIPRVFELNDPAGWSIYTAKIKGIWLKLVFETLASFGEPLAYSGIEMKFMKTPFGIKIGRAYINGKKINPFKVYTVAFTEGIIRGAVEISAKTKILLRHPEKTEDRIWQTLQERVIRDGEILNTKEISESNRTFYYPENDE